MGSYREDVRREQLYADEQMSKSMMLVSTGAIALSITYYTETYFSDIWVLVLSIGWVLLLASVVLNVLAYYFQRQASQAVIEDWPEVTLKKCNTRVFYLDRASVGAFIIGIVVLAGTIVTNILINNIEAEGNSNAINSIVEIK